MTDHKSPVVWNSRTSGPIVHDSSYYAKCMLGGVLACGLTHTLMTPLDITKGLISGLKTIVAEESGRAIWKGWAPTLIGYSLQGAFKYGLYESFKDFYSNLAGKENAEKYKGLIWCAGSASAEVFADIALCPLEMVKIKVQTSPAGTWPTGFGAAMSQMYTQRAETGFPYRSLVPLWSRQIPYTVAKFYFFEKVVALFYSKYTAGVICAIVSHPADSIVSQLGKASNKGKFIGTIASEVGITNLLTKGLATRVLMIGTLTGLQWWIYDSFKTAMGMGTSGGK